MKTMLYVTKLISKSDNEEVHIYISLKDFKKIVFIEERGVLIPKNDHELLDALNHVSGIMYDENSTQQDKRPLTLKERLQKALAVLGVGVVIMSVYPAASDLISYSLKRVKSYSYSDVVNENTLDSDFIKQFELSINKNEGFLPEEKTALVNGYKKYFADWGYLFDEVDKQYVLHMAENVNVHRNVSLRKNVSGRYGLNNIYLKSNEDMDTTTHESCHAFSDRGLYTGTINGFGFGYAINEAVNTDVNDQYFTEDISYASVRADLLKLSLLVGDETFIESYQKKGPFHIVKSLKNAGIDVFDSVRFISMMDVGLLIEQGLIGNFKLLDNFHKEKEELYGKMFKQKFGYDYSESILGTSKIQSSNFLSGKVVLGREECFYHRDYELDKSILPLKTSSIDLSEHMIDEFMLINDNYKNQLLVQDPVQTAIELGSWEVFSNYVIGRDATDEEVNHIKSIFEYGVDENNYQLYAECVVKKALSYNLPADFVACYLRGANSVSYDSFYKDFDEALISELKKYDRDDVDDVIDLYCNTTINFSYFDFDNPSLYQPDSYHILREKEDYVITDNNNLVFKFNDDEFDLGNLIYDGKLMNEYDWDISTDATYNDIFESENQMFFVFDFSKVGIDKVNRNLVDFKVSLHPKILQYDNSNSVKSSK